MSRWFEIDRDVSYAQCANCLFALHVGGTLILFGIGAGGYAARLEIMTDSRWFRFRRRVKP